MNYSKQLRKMKAEMINIIKGSPLVFDCTENICNLGMLQDRLEWIDDVAEYDSLISVSYINKVSGNIMDCKIININSGTIGIIDDNDCLASEGNIKILPLDQVSIEDLAYILSEINFI